PPTIPRGNVVAVLGSSPPSSWLVDADSSGVVESSDDVAFSSDEVVSSVVDSLPEEAGSSVDEASPDVTSDSFVFSSTTLLLLELEESPPGRCSQATPSLSLSSPSGSLGSASKC